MSQSGVKCLITIWTQSNTKPLHCVMRPARGPNTFSFSPTGLHGFSGIVRLLLNVLFLLIVLFYALFVCNCVLYYCHRVSTQLQLTNNCVSGLEVYKNICLFSTVYRVTQKDFYARPYTSMWARVVARQISKRYSSSCHVFISM